MNKGTTGLQKKKETIEKHKKEEKKNTSENILVELNCLPYFIPIPIHTHRCPLLESNQSPPHILSVIRKPGISELWNYTSEALYR